MQSQNEPYKQPGKRGGAKSSFSFRKGATIPSALPQSSPTEPATQSISLYAFNDIPLEVFAECVVSGDKSGIIREGAPGPDAVEARWLEIYSDYCDKVGGVQLSALVGRTRQANILSSRLDRLYMAVDLAREIACEELAEIFRVEGFTLDPNAPEEQYHQQLDRIIAGLRPHKMKLAALAKDFEGEQAKAPTMDDFDNTRFEVAKYQGFAAPHNMLLREYCIGVRKLQEHIKQLSKGQRHGKRNA